jgi:hypothetical protein
MGKSGKEKRGEDGYSNKKTVRKAIHNDRNWV